MRRPGERQVFTSIHGCFRASWMVSRFLPDREHVFTSPPVLCVCLLSPLVLLQQLADEPLGQLAGVAEELLVKLVVYGGDVPQGVVFGLPQEGRGPAQPGSRRTLAFFRADRLLVPEHLSRMSGSAPSACMNNNWNLLLLKRPQNPRAVPQAPRAVRNRLSQGGWSSFMRCSFWC